MTVDFIPRRYLLARLEQGWTLVPGHEYLAADWAILMAAPMDTAPPKSRDVAKAFSQFRPGRRRRQPVRKAVIA